MATLPALSLKGRALKYLALREHSRSELARKLTPHAQDEDAVHAVLDELQDRGLFSEDRFVESLIHKRSTRHGVARIRQELQAKGISAEQVREALAPLADTEFIRAQNLWERRFGSPPTDLKSRQQQTRFLMTRGFSAHVVRQVLEHAHHHMPDSERFGTPNTGIDFDDGIPHDELP